MGWFLLLCSCADGWRWHHFIAFCYTCWFGFQAVVCGEAFASILQGIGVPIPSMLSTIIWGMIMCITAVYGYSWIEKLNVIAVPALILILVYAMIVVFGDPESIVKITNHTPTTQMSMIAAVGTSIGGFASGAVLSGDVTRYCKSRKDVVISSIDPTSIVPTPTGMTPTILEITTSFRLLQ